MDERQRASASEREAVRQAARTYALDWYLAALLAPRNARDDLVTLAAFTGETSRIPLTVSEPALGAIRLRWWRDAIDNSDGGTRTGNPVTDALTEASRRRAFGSEMLALPLDGRERELDANGLVDDADLGLYLDEAWGTPFRLAVRALGHDETDATQGLCNLSAGAYGRTRLALDLPRYLSHGRLPLPQARLAGADPRRLPEPEARTAAKALIAMLSKEAREDLAKARTALRTAPKALRPVFLPLALVEPYLRALENPGHDPLRDIADISPLKRLVRLWLANVRGTV